MAVNKVVYGTETLIDLTDDTATEVDVASGDSVERGQTLGTGGDGVYFEYRQNGESVDPAAEMGL